MTDDDVPTRFVGWSVDRVDGSSSFGTFSRRESAEDCEATLRRFGNEVRVVAAEVPDEYEALQAENARLVAELDRYAAIKALLLRLCAGQEALGLTAVDVEDVRRALGVGDGNV